MPRGGCTGFPIGQAWDVPLGKLVVATQSATEVAYFSVDVDTAEAAVIGEARTRTHGDDVTIVSWSQTANFAVEAAETLAGEGIGAQVVDLRSLWPWDKNAVLDSVNKTGRLIVAHESVAVGGFGAEVVAIVSEKVGAALQGRVRRLGAPRALIAYAPNLENKMRVTAEMIVDAARDLMQ